MNELKAPRFQKRTLHLEVTGLPAAPTALDAWERALVEPALARLLDDGARPTAARDSEGVADGEAR